MTPERLSINGVFPTELFHQIFEALSRQDNGLLTLTECTLVCKLWCELARAYQFATVVVRRDLELFRDFCVSTPRVASQIKTLHFYGRSIASRQQRLRKAMSPIPIDVFTTNVLPFLPLLRSLHFSNVTFDIQGCSAIAHVQDVHRRPFAIRSLEVAQCSGVASALPVLLSSFSTHTLTLTNLKGGITDAVDALNVVPDGRYQPKELVIFRCWNLQAYHTFLDGILSAGGLRALGAYSFHDNIPAFASLLSSDKLRNLVSFTFDIDYHHYFDPASSFGPNSNITAVEGVLEDLSAALSRLANLQYLELSIQTNGLPKLQADTRRPRIFARLLKHPLAALRSLNIRVELFVRAHAWEGYAGDYLDLNSIDTLLTNSEEPLAGCSADPRPPSVRSRSPLLESVTLEVRWRSDRGALKPGWAPKLPQEFDPPLFPRLRAAGKFRFAPRPYVEWLGRGA